VIFKEASKIKNHRYAFNKYFEEEEVCYDIHQFPPERRRGGAGMAMTEGRLRKKSDLSNTKSDTK